MAQQLHRRLTNLPLILIPTNLVSCHALSVSGLVFFRFLLKLNFPTLEVSFGITNLFVILPSAIHTLVFFFLFPQEGRRSLRGQQPELPLAEQLK